MAIEGVVANPGVGGAEFAVDQVAGGSGTVDVPYVKLMSGTDTDAAVIPGDATNGLDVDVTRVSGNVAVTNAGLTALAGAIAGTEVQADIVAALPTGANVIGGVTQSGTWNIGTVTTVTTVSAVTAISNALPAGNNNIGDVDVASIAAGTNMIGAVTPRPDTANGLAIARDIDLDNGTLTVVKASAGQLYGWDITNRGTAPIYVKFYNATSGTLGTGTPEMTIAIPANASDYTLSSKALFFGIAFGTGICVGAGTGVADADNTDPGANIVVANIYYK